MQFLIDLWLPILISGVVLFFASFAAWVLLPHHFGDRKKLPAEDKFMQFVREQNVAAGNYMFPYTATKAEQQSKEHMEKYAAGPRGCLDVYDMPNMPANMAKTVAFFLVTSAVIGYITHVACPPGGDGVDFMRVFRIAGTIGILTHASSGICNAIWFKKRTWTDMLDGIAYGLILGLIFAVMWPTGA